MKRAGRNLPVVTYLLFALTAVVTSLPAAAAQNEWTKLGPEGGYIYEIVYSKTTPTTIYAMATSGLHRSLDGGATWQLRPVETSPRPSHVSLDPSHADRFYFLSGLQPFVSVDRGTTFQHLPTPTGVRFNFLEVAVDGTLYAVADASSILYRSTDQGQTWVALTSPKGKVLLDPSNANTLYSMVAGDGLYVTTDAGGSWNRRAGIATLESLQPVPVIIIDPRAPNRWWALSAPKILFSNDGAITWSEVYAASTSSSVTWPATLAFSPSDPLQVYVGLVGGTIIGTLDQGAHWNPAGDRGEGILTMAINPAQSTELLVAGHAGLAVGNINGTSWSARNSGLIASSTNNFAVGGSNRIYFVSSFGVHYLQGDTVSAVNNAGLMQLVRQKGIQSLFLTALHIPAGAPDTLYLVRDYDLYKSLDAGSTWSALPSSPKQVFGFIGPRNDAQVLYIGSQDGVIKSTNGGMQWTAVNSGLPSYDPPPSTSQKSHVWTLAMGSDPSLVYAGTLGAGVYKTTNAAQSWIPANGGIEETRVYDIKVDPSDDRIVYAATTTNDGTARRIAKSTDGGMSWTNVVTASNFEYFLGIAIDPSNPKIIIAHTVERILRSTDAGATWQTIRQTAPAFTSNSINSVIIDPLRPDVVFANSGNDGVQQFTVAPDLELTVSTPTSLTRNSAGAYTLSARNRSSFDATNVRVVVQLPATATAANLTGANCSGVGTTWTCDLPQLRQGTTQNIIINFTPTTVGQLQIDASIAGGQQDVSTSNNSVTNITSVNEPAAPSSGGGGGGALSSPMLSIFGLFASLRRLRLQRANSFSRKARG